MKAIFTRASRTSTIWGAVAFLTLALIGLINLTHADFYSGKSFHKAQLVWTVVGFVVAIGTFMPPSANAFLKSLTMQSRSVAVASIGTSSLSWRLTP